MSQPTEGQPQRTWTETLDWLANQPQQNLENLGALASLQKNEFDRLIKQAQKVPLKDKVQEKVSNATARAHAVFDREKTRLSDMAQRLQSQAGQQLNAGREWAGRQVDRADAFMGRQADRADAFVNRQIDRADAFVDRQVDRATEFGQQAVGAYQSGIEAAGRGIQAGRQQLDRAAAFGGQQIDRATAFGGRQVDKATELGGRAMDAGRNLRDQAGRWLDAQKGRVTRAAEGARATVAMAKFDGNMPGVTTQDLTHLSQQHSRIMTGPTLDARLAAAQQVAQQLQAQKDAQTVAQAFGGLAPAGQAVSQGQGGTETQQPTEQAAKANLTKKDTDLKR